METRRLQRRRRALHALLELAACSARGLYDSLLEAFTDRKFFLSFDTFSDILDRKLGLGERDDVSSSTIQRVVVDAFEVKENAGREGGGGAGGWGLGVLWGGAGLQGPADGESVAFRSRAAA
jgi:hypothetical protein